VALVDRDHLGVAAPGHRREDALAEADLGHAGADAADDAGHLAARAERELGAMLVLPLDDENVGEVAADRPDLDDHLAGIRPGRGRLGVFQRRRLTPRARQHRLHRLPLGPPNRSTGG
jgi:hypothetical protein